MKMKFKQVLFALIVIFFIFALANVVSAAENNTAFVNNTQNDVSTPDIDISQSYWPSVVNKDDAIDVYLDITNNGNETVHNLTIFYNVPKEFQLLIYPAEYDGEKIIVDSLYPGEKIRFTFVSQALESNVTATFEAGLDGSTMIPLDIYVQPESGNNESNQSDSSNSGQLFNNGNFDSNSTGNPFALLILGLFMLPLSIHKKH